MVMKKLDLESIKATAKKNKSDANRNIAAKAGTVNVITNTKADHTFRAVKRCTGQHDDSVAIKSLFHCNVPHNHQEDMGGELQMKNIRSLMNSKQVDEEIGTDLIDLKKLCAFTQMQMQLQVAKGCFDGVANLPMFEKTLKPWLKEKGYDSSLFETWIPQLNTAFFFEEVIIDPYLERHFSTYNMRTKTERVNHLLGKLKGRLQQETDTYGVQQQSSDFIDFSAQDNVVHTEIYTNLLQDADPNAFNSKMTAIVEGLGIAREEALLFGDDSTTTVQGDNHMDSDIAADAATNFAKAWKGLRKLALDNSANDVALGHGGGSIDKSIFQDLIRAMPVFAKNKTECMWIVPTGIKRKIDTGIIAELLSHDYVTRGLIETGERNSLFGIPIYESQFMREDLGVNGVYTADSSKTSIILVNKKRFFMGVRAPIRLWSAPALPNIDKLMMTGKERISFSGAKQSAVEKSVAIGYNIESM